MGDKQTVADAVRKFAGRVCIRNHVQRPWASVTFSGARHTLQIEFEQIDAMGRFIAGLDEHEFAIPRLLVADATVTMITSVPALTVGVELLVLDDPS